MQTNYNYKTLLSDRACLLSHIAQNHKDLSATDTRINEAHEEHQAELKRFTALGEAGRLADPDDGKDRPIVVRDIRLCYEDDRKDWLDSWGSVAVDRIIEEKGWCIAVKYDAYFTNSASALTILPEKPKFHEDGIIPIELPAIPELISNKYDYEYMGSGWANNGERCCYAFVDPCCACTWFVGCDYIPDGTGGHYVKLTKKVPEVKEMTVAEISEALGKTIKVIEG